MKKLLTILFTFCAITIFAQDTPHIKVTSADSIEVQFLGVTKATITKSGNLGIGVTEPSASIDLKAGTTTVAPIKLTDGDLLATPVSGTIEYSNDRLYITNVGVQRSVDRTSDVILETDTVVNTTDETILYTGLIGADAFKVGNILKLNCSGILSNNSASDDITISVYIGSDLVLSYNPEMGNVTDEHWHIAGNMTVRTVGAGGTMAYHLDSEINGDSESFAGIGSINTTAANNFTVRAEWDHAKADNIIMIYQGFTEWKN